MICASVYLLVFIRNLFMHLAEKILLMHPLDFGEDYPKLRDKIGIVRNFVHPQKLSIRALSEKVGTGFSTACLSDILCKLLNRHWFQIWFGILSPNRIAN
jgi:hypothetical protein